MVLALVWPKILNLPLILKGNATFPLRFMLSSGAISRIEYLINRANQRFLPVILTQADGKFYIGYCFSFHFAEDHDWVLISPLFSGYRGKTKEIKITTDYVWTWELDDDHSNSKGVRFEDFEVVIPLATLQSVHPFNVASYHEKFNSRVVFVDRHGDEISTENDEDGEASAGEGGQLNTKVRKLSLRNVFLCVWSSLTNGSWEVNVRMQILMYWVFAILLSLAVVIFDLFGFEIMVASLFIAGIGLGTCMLPTRFPGAA
jgi:hypothetical protein